MKFYPDISASDQAIQMAIARNFRKCERGSAWSQAISREQILPGSDLIFEIWVLRASVFVFECFVFETTAKVGPISSNDFQACFPSLYLEIKEIKRASDQFKLPQSSLILHFIAEGHL